jgi:hypothetical protein
MSSDFSCTTPVRARKARTCCECHQTIQRTELYVKVAGKWDGDFYSTSHCVRCEQLIQELARYKTWAGYYYPDECGYDIGDLINDAVETFYERGSDDEEMLRYRDLPLSSVGGLIREELLMKMKISRGARL